MASDDLIGGSVSAISPKSNKRSMNVTHAVVVTKDHRESSLDNDEEMCSTSAPRHGFGVLMGLEDDMFEADTAESVLSVLQDENNNSGLGNKRNRQISTDSSSSNTNEVKRDEKVKKKPKKERKNQFDAEIEKILLDLEGNSKTSNVGKKKLLSKPKDDENSVENELPTIDKQAKKKKKRRAIVADDTASTVSRLGDNNNVALTQVDGSLKNSGCEKIEVIEEHLSPVIATDDAETAKILKTKDDGKKDRKKPGKKQIEAMQTALRKAKEEKERFLQEELAKQKLSEERERLVQEKLRLEREKKEIRKQKEKDRKERMKAEGRFLTKTQKAARARMQNALSTWREHGIDVPNIGEKKPFDHKSFQKKKNNRDMRDLEQHVDPSDRQEPITKTSESEDGSNTDLSISDSNSLQSLRQRHFTDSELELGLPDSDSWEAVHASKSEVALRTAQKEVNERFRTKSESELCNSRTRFKDKLLESCRLQTELEEEKDCPYRSPIVCVLGHVDTGKTKILDQIRKTHVQDNEAGGITQQIGATMVPREALREKCKMANSFADFVLELPGLLIIDTPGHESFWNLRSRGSSLCDIAILVVDIMHGIEPQTVESIDLLKKRKTPFVVALNKIDRIYGWETDSASDVEDVIKRQNTGAHSEFDMKCKHVIAEFSCQGLNASLFYDNPDPRSYISMVPVSAVTGDGMGNLLALVSKLCQTMMVKRLTFQEELEATVLEVKTTAGLGTTIDVILVNGRLREGDTIVVAGHEGPVVTQIRSILMPQPLKELRVKNAYQEFKCIKGAQGVKISGKDFHKAIAGLPLFVSRNADDIPELKEKMEVLFRNTINAIHLDERGVYVQASTLGSLEALVEFLKNSNVPYAGVKVGPVVKKDVIKASVMLEHDIQYAAILAFDVKVEKDAQELADHLGIKLFQADIIYHLFDKFTEYREQLLEKKKVNLKKFAVFPCKLRILPEFVFNVKDPIVLGVHVEAGTLKTGTPINVPSRNFLDLGTVSTLEIDHKLVDCAKEGDEVCVKIEAGDESTKACYGRHFDESDMLVSKISRQTIDICKEYYRDDMQKSDWKLIVELKKLFSIV